MVWAVNLWLSLFDLSLFYFGGGKESAWQSQVDKSQQDKLLWTCMCVWDCVCVCWGGGVSYGTVPLHF